MLFEYHELSTYHANIYFISVFVILGVFALI